MICADIKHQTERLFPRLMEKGIPIRDKVNYLFTLLAIHENNKNTDIVSTQHLFF